LYSDGDVFAVDAMRPLLLAGLDPTFYNQDLIERIIRVTLTKPREYMDDERFREYRAANLPQWRGALYQLVADVLRDVDNVKQSSSRFGVFSRVGECVARIMGHDAGWFAQRYLRLCLELAEEAGSADSVYVFLVGWIQGLDDHIGAKVTRSPTALFIEMRTTMGDLTNVVSIKDVPGNARAISPRIVQASSLLEKTMGWRVSRGHNREFIFEKVEDVEAPADDIIAMMRAATTARDSEGATAGGY
jgi:hypothetical protein